MIKELSITILPEFVENQDRISKAIASELNVKNSEITHFEILKRAIDARKKVNYQLKVRAFIGEKPIELPPFNPEFKNVKNAEPVHIIGAGPAGMFASLRCLQLGLKPIVLERGKDVRARRRDLAKINKEGIVNPESNYCFGEGGAGTYSDGKLYTRSKKRGDVELVLNFLVHFGADPDILVNARPHIGTNKLPAVITAIRECIEELGGEFHFEKKFTGFDKNTNSISHLILNDGEKVPCTNLILATGHSAHDIYEMLNEKQVLLEAKPFALGVRIEHNQDLIDKIQYNCETRGEFLPPAYYSLTQQVNKRGVFSFCMCPGGIIAPCATGNESIVVNGWSPSKRNNPYSNSGTVVQVTPNDIPNFENDSLAGLKFQQEIEKNAALAGGGLQVAPAQRMLDFVKGKISSDLPDNSYLPGTKSTQLSEILPEFVTTSLKAALPLFGNKMRGYYSNDAILVGVESRTSSPVRIPRIKETGNHPEITNLYPCGEGAGFAGGIVSAAMDGFFSVNCIAANK
ncbi:MAG: putative FAD-dependent dehydrogenase [Sphingobacteriales bacterium]|jgi:uncharacterized FAD-dependent dehydrogenase